MAAADYYQRLEVASDKAKLTRLSSVAKIERANLYNLNLGRSNEADLLYQEVIERLKGSSDERTYVDSVILYSGFLAKRGYFEKATNALDSVELKIKSVNEIKTKYYLLRGNVEYQQGLYSSAKNSLNNASKFSAKISNPELRELLVVLISNIFCCSSLSLKT